MIERLTRIRDRIASGIPLEEPIEDVRFLLELLHDTAQVYELETCPDFCDVDPDDFWHYGFSIAELMKASLLPPRRKRCEMCGGDGIERDIDKLQAVVDRQVTLSTEPIKCDSCNGTGYEEARG